MTYYYQGLQIQTPFMITNNRQAFEVETLSLKRKTFVTEAQRWELSFNVITTGNEAALMAAHTWLYHSTKTMIMPQLPQVRKAYSFNGSLAATVDNLTGADTVLVTSSGQTGTATIPAGTFISFAGHTKVYVIKSAVSFTNGTTNIPLSIFPNLVYPVNTSQSVNLDAACLLSYKLDLSSGQGLSFVDGILTSPGTIKLIEALQ
jgi:hypothetical protein